MQTAQSVEIEKGTTTSRGFGAVVATTFLTSFNDNAFRTTIVLLAYHLYQEEGSGSALASLSAILFLLPYALLSLVAGIMADRFSKRSLILICKIAEVPTVSAGIVALAYARGEARWPIFLMLTLLVGLGVQTAFMYPSRYGLLPEILEEEELSQGNGDLEMGNYLGLLCGTLAAGLIVRGVSEPETYWFGLLLMPLASLLGTLSAWFIPRVPAANPTEPIGKAIDPKLFMRNWRLLASHQGLVPTVYGLTFFWGISMLYLLNTPHFGQVYLGFSNDPSENTPLLVAISVGVGLGSYLAGKISKGRIELGLVPIGAACWLLASVGLSLVDSFWPTCVLLALAGMSGGLFVVPLNSFLEMYSPPADRASCIATSNIVTVLGMIAASGVNYLLASVFEVGPKAIFLVAGLVLVFATWWTIGWLKEYFVRLSIIFLTRSIYRIRLVGAENVPRHGPAIMVLNHVSFADGNLIVSSFSRFVRFVVYRGHYEFALLRWMGEAMRAIPVDSEAPPKQIVQSLHRAAEALQRGELLCVFAEGSITRVGFLLPFQRGFELILKRTPDVPIIPGYIDGMWGSIFSFHRGKFFRKWPKRIRYPVTIHFGVPMAANSTALQVRQQVQALGAETVELRHHLPLSRQFVRTAKRFSRRPCMADSMTATLTFGQSLMRSVILTRLLGRRLGTEQFVGLLVPPSVGGALANIALANLGKIPVNLNYTVGIEVLNQCIRQCGIRQIVASRKLIDKLDLKPDAELIFLEDLRGDLRTSDKLAGLAARFAPAWVTEELILKLPNTQKEDLATIIFSSGSTGEPKGVMLTQHNIASNIDSIVQMVDATEQDKLMGVLPFFHSFGFTVTLWLPLTIGASSVYHFNPLDAEIVGNLIRDHKATIFVSTATFLRGYIRKCGEHDFRSLRLIICGAEKLPMQVADQFEKKFGVRPMEGYGCTELSPAVACNRPDFEYNGYRQVGHKPGTIGHPMPGIAVRVVDPETEVVLPVGEEGLLQVKGANVMKGYLNKPELTAEVIKDGWYNTGDIAKLDADGFITITDRMSRFSKIGGEMVPHGKIEETMHEILDTHERLCAVVGIPDPRKGERLIVLHTPLPISVDELWDKLRQRVPPIWLPSKHSFFEIDEFPVLGTGKTDLKRIKSLAHEKTGV